MKAPGGAVRLLTQADVAVPKVIGWGPTKSGFGGLSNPGGWALLRIVVQKVAQGGDKLQDKYDQVLIVENPGSIVVPLMAGKVGLTEVFRFDGERLETAEQGYVEACFEQDLWGELLKKMGQWKWECPRGLAPDAEGTALETTFERVAKKEALEEAGLKLTSLEVVGWVNPNSTFFAHAQAVVRGEVVDQQGNQPEDREILGVTRFFTPAQVRQLVKSHQLTDGLTKAALADAGFHY